MIVFETLINPILLNCGHNFCQACITRVWDGLEENFSCPKCGKRFQERHLHPNPLLGKVTLLVSSLSPSLGFPCTLPMQHPCRVSLTSPSNGWSP
uniref:RING-type domain-containing protein n=1 Tax=Chrysemys picta bellii TaxID=8478 RepID=A0A8C3IBW3_CHRPI